MDVDRKARSPLLLVVKDEHADASRLPVGAAAKKDGPLRSGDGFSQLRGDPLRVGSRPATEKGKGDVDVLARHGPGAAVTELAITPLEQRIEDVVRKREAAEESESGTAFDGTRRGHTRV